MDRLAGNAHRIELKGEIVKKEKAEKKKSNFITHNPPSKLVAPL